MGRYIFFNDFFTTDIMNHMEALKVLIKLETEDEKLLVPALFQLTKGREEKQRIYPFYPNHEDVFKNVFRVIESRAMAQHLRGHKFNIYECSSLELNNELLITVAFAFTMQMFLFVCLVYHSISDSGALFSNWWLREDKIILVIAVVTTIFFAKLAWTQSGEAYTFDRIFKKAGTQSSGKGLLRYMNIIINVYVAIALTIFNFFFISISEDSIEAILNGLAIYFILELDELLAPNWDDDKLYDAIGTNLQDYFKEDAGEDIQVEIIQTPHDDQSEKILLNGDDKVYIQIEHFDGFHAITIHWRRSPLEYEQFRFKITGNESDEMLRNIENFRCVQNFIDLNGPCVGKMGKKEKKNDEENDFENNKEKGLKNDKEKGLRNGNREKRLSTLKNDKENLWQYVSKNSLF